MTDFLRAYLLGYFFALGIALGSLVVIMLHNLTGGAWGTAIRRTLEPAAKTIPVFALLFLPIAIGAPSLYIWARPEAAAGDPILEHALHHKAAYLNLPFFLARAAVYFAIWIGLSRVMTARPANPDREFKLAGPGLILYGLTMTFAAVDWIMSLDPAWYSTVFGLLLMVGQVLSAFAFAIARGARRGDIPVEPLHDLGKLLLAFVMVWAYIGLSQWRIIWSGNLPEEIPWYLKRLQGGYEWIALAVIVLHFAFPFVILLSRATKRNPGLLAKVASFILIMRVVDLYWMIAPDAQGGAHGGGGHGGAAYAGLHVSPLDAVAPVVLYAAFLAAMKLVGGSESWKSSEAT